MSIDGFTSKTRDSKKYEEDNNIINKCLISHHECARPVQGRSVSVAIGIYPDAHAYINWKTRWNLKIDSINTKINTKIITRLKE